MAPDNLAKLMKETLAIRRIQQFLQTDDIEYLSLPEDIRTTATSDQSALVMNGDVTWHYEEADPDVFTLRNLALTFPRGKITLVAGKAGSGKTLLLLALLGEAKLLRGHITYAISPIQDPDQMDGEMDWSTLSGGVAYVPQVAWLQSLNIRYAEFRAT